MEKEVEVEQLELVVEVFDHEGNFDGEWTYAVTRNSIEQWEAVDTLDYDHGKSLVRYLLLSKLKEHSYITWELLSNNTCLGEFLTEGVPGSIVLEIPRLSVVNTAVDRMYDCLCRIVIDEQIRVVH